MKKAIILCFFLLSLCFAKEDYSEMSNQELIAIMGYVKDKNKQEFLKELNSRVSTMTDSEKTMYENNKEKLKQNEK